MNKMGTIICAMLVLGILVAGMSGCKKKEGPMESTGKAMDNAAEKTGEKIDKSVEKTGEKVEKAGEKIKDSVK